MKIRRSIVCVCVAGGLVLLVVGVFTGAPGEGEARGGRSRPVAKFFPGEDTMASRVHADRKSSRPGATTVFKIVGSSAPDLFAAGSGAQGSGGPSPAWLEAQVNSLTSPAALERVVRELRLAEEWGLTASAATTALRAMTEVSYEEEPDIVAVTVRASDAAQSAAIANAVREAYVAGREGMEAERARRLETNISYLQAAMEKSTKDTTNGYASRGSGAESQLERLNAMKEQHLRISVNAGLTGNAVEVLKTAQPGPAD